MAPKGILSRIGSIVSLPLALCLLIFFFLPWLNLTCAGQKLGSASGLQLASGKMTEEKVFDESDSGVGIVKTDEGKKESLSDAIKARPWFFLCLVIPIALLLIGVMGLVGRLSPGGASGALIVLGVVGLIMMILASSVDYSDEIVAKQKQENAKKAGAASTEPAGMDALGASMGKEMEQQMKQKLKTEATGIVWTSLVFYILVALCGVVDLVLPKAMGAVSAPTAQSPSPPPSA